jgi:predicted RNA-binding protein with PUA-like domain
MNYWLVKSEPETWSWADHVADGTSEWDGVRNHQAKLNLQAMKRGDRAFFYHSGKEKQIVGIVRVVKTYYPDPTDKTDRFGMVDFKVVKPLKNPVTLARIRQDKRLNDLPLIKNTRLSVQPVDDASWQIICNMGGE